MLKAGSLITDGGGNDGESLLGRIDSLQLQAGATLHGVDENRAITVNSREVAGVKEQSAIPTFLGPAKG